MSIHRKFVVTASDHSAAKPNCEDCYRVEQAQKIGLSMCMANDNGREVPRQDAQGLPVTVNIEEVFIDQQGHVVDESGTVLTPNTAAHSFSILKRGYVEITKGEKPRDAQVFTPVAEKLGNRDTWTLKPTDAKAIAAKASASADELEGRAKALRARASGEVEARVEKVKAEKASQAK